MIRLKEERLRRGWRVTDVAERIGISGEKTIRRWERGASTPKPENLTKLCSLFGMTPEELGLEGSDQ